MIKNTEHGRENRGASALLIIIFIFIRSFYRMVTAASQIGQGKRNHSHG
jgi:hypothetical protein